MWTMSLFSFNRIYKPNRHTPTPLTQTHTISFLLHRYPFLSEAPKQHRAETDSVRISSAKQKVRVIACDGEKSWVQAAAVGECIDGSREHFVPPVRATTLILFLVRPGFIYDSRAPASRWMGTRHGHCDVRCTRFSKNIKSNMHEAVTGVGQQLLYSLSPSLHSVSLSCLGKKALRGLRLPDVGRAQGWSDCSSEIGVNLMLLTLCHLNR